MMHPSLRFPAAALLLLLARPAAGQLSLSNNSGSATAQSVFPGAVSFLPAITDVHAFGPNGGGAVSDVDLNPFGHMRAVQTGYGLNAVYADGTVSDLPYFDYSARTTIDWTVVNSGVSSSPVDFQYHLNSGYLALYDPSSMFDGNQASVGVGIFTLAPGFSGVLWSWKLTLRGNHGVVTPTVDFLIDHLGFGVPALSPVTIANGVAAVDIGA